eukprot:9502705-Pyramimonas_sp.AAC.1
MPMHVYYSGRYILARKLPDKALQTSSSYITTTLHNKEHNPDTLHDRHAFNQHPMRSQRSCLHFTSSNLMLRLRIPGPGVQREGLREVVQVHAGATR